MDSFWTTLVNDISEGVEDPESELVAEHLSEFTDLVIERSNVLPLIYLSIMLYGKDDIGRENLA